MLHPSGSIVVWGVPDALVASSLSGLSGSGPPLPPSTPLGSPVELVLLRSSCPLPVSKSKPILVRIAVRDISRSAVQVASCILLCRCTAATVAKSAQASSSRTLVAGIRSCKRVARSPVNASLETGVVCPSRSIRSGSTSGQLAFRRNPVAFREMRRAVAVGALVAGGAGATYTSQPPESKSRWQFAAFDVLNPVLRALVDGESAHIAAVAAASRGWIPTEHRPDCSSLRVTVWGLNFTNPIGLAAGFDKHAEAYPALLDMGFGFVEIGSVTPLPQDGNPKPRVFRLPADRAVINRYGFNSQGHKAAADRLAAHPTGSVRGVLGVNLGKNKVQPDASADYVAGVHELAESLLHLQASAVVLSVRDARSSKERHKCWH